MADDGQDWYASVSLLAEGTTEVEHGDPARDEHHRAIVTASPADIARDLSALAQHPRLAPPRRTPLSRHA
jgi:hypothetical protein